MPSTYFVGGRKSHRLKFYQKELLFFLTIKTRFLSKRYTAYSHYIFVGYPKIKTIFQVIALVIEQRCPGHRKKKDNVVQCLRMREILARNSKFVCLLHLRSKEVHLMFRERIYERYLSCAMVYVQIQLEGTDIFVAMLRRR